MSFGIMSKEYLISLILLEACDVHPAAHGKKVSGRV